MASPGLDAESAEEDSDALDERLARLVAAAPRRGAPGGPLQCRKPMAVPTPAQPPRTRARTPGVGGGSWPQRRIAEGSWRFSASARRP